MHVCVFKRELMHSHFYILKLSQHWKSRSYLNQEYTCRTCIANELRGCQTLTRAREEEKWSSLSLRVHWWCLFTSLIDLHLQASLGQEDAHSQPSVYRRCSFLAFMELYRTLIIGQEQEFTVGRTNRVEEERCSSMSFLSFYCFFLFSSSFSPFAVFLLTCEEEKTRTTRTRTQKK